MDNLKSNMFESEEMVLRSAEELLTKEEYKDNPLIPFFYDITENYKRILKEIKKIIRISDGQQEYMHKVQMELKREIQRRISVEEQLHKLASTDTLTGVYNRGTGLSLLDKLLKNIRRSNGLFSICFVDINGLKFVNDNFGHHEGDELILTICGSLKDVLRDGDIICRLGGDEFLLVFPESDTEGVKKILQRVLDTPRFRNMQNQKPYEISFSYGIVEVTEENKYSLDELIELADRKMYQHKEEYKRSQKNKPSPSA